MPNPRTTGATATSKIENFIPKRVIVPYVQIRAADRLKRGAATMITERKANARTATTTAIDITNNQIISSSVLSLISLLIRSSEITPYDRSETPSEFR